MLKLKNMDQFIDWENLNEEDQIDLSLLIFGFIESYYVLKKFKSKIMYF
jgi:hypothetical protein